MKRLKRWLFLQAAIFGCLAYRLSAQPVTPNDPQFSLQWHLGRIGATNAWGVTTGGTNIVVAVIDTGVDYTHPDLAANMWSNPGETGVDTNGNDKATNGIDDDGNGYVDDVHGANVTDGTGDPMDIGYFYPPAAPIYHGTFCAGIIGAVGNNGVGVAGLNWSVQMMAVGDGGGDATDLKVNSETLFYSDIVASFKYVLMMKRRGVNIRVVSASLYSFVPGKELEEILSELDREGVLSVFAAGNERLDFDLYSGFPGCFNLSSLLVIANSTRTDALNAVSPTEGSNFGASTVDIAAPGTDILSTTKGVGYTTKTGTSFSCPLVAGAAALLLSADPNLTVDQLKAALFGSVDQSAALKGKVMTNGRLNVFRALQYLTNSNPPAIVITALPAGQRTATNFPIQATFNRPMNRASVESALVIQPPLAGTFAWTNGDRSFAFHHDTPFDPTTNYTVRVLGTARDAEGGTLDGDFDRTREGSPADDFVWTFRFPVPNDDFANAQLLAGTSGQIDGNNRYATWDVSEPQSVERGAQIRGNTVWYRWTPPEPGGWFTFDLTKGTTFDSMLDIFAGDAIEQLTLLASNDNYGSQRGGRISFAPLPGTNYFVRVSGKNAYDPAQAGVFQLAWYATPPPGFTGSQFLPASGIPGAKVTLTGTNFTGATSVLFNGVSASFTNAPTNNFDLRITAVVPPDAISGPITIVTPHGSVTSTMAFQILPPPLTIRLAGANGLEIAWPATSPEFLLETSEDLSASSWTPVTGAFLMGNGTTKLTLLAPTGKRFYRLKTR